MADYLQHGYWQKRWDNQEIASFHRDTPSHLLARFFDAWAASYRNDPNARVLLPLCGRSVDMLWLERMWRGEVVGVEFIRSEVERFFELADRQAEFKYAGDTPVYRSDRLTIYVDDFSVLGPDKLGTFHCAYDRAAITCFSGEERRRYVSIIHDLLEPGGCLLLLVPEFRTHRLAERPPFGMSEQIIHTYFGDRFVISALGAYPAQPGVHAEPDLVSCWVIGKLPSR